MEGIQCVYVISVSLHRETHLELREFLGKEGERIVGVVGDGGD